MVVVAVAEGMSMGLVPGWRLCCLYWWYKVVVVVIVVAVVVVAVSLVVR